jgi:hypothetical protein
MVAGREGCPDAGQAGRCPVRVHGPTVRTSVQPVERTSSVQVSGRIGLRWPGVRCIGCPDGQASGVRGAAALSGPRWALEWLGVAGGRPSVSGSTCRRGRRAAWSPAGIGPDGKQWYDVGRPWLARGSTVAQVRRLAGLPAPARVLVQARVPAGGGEHGTEQVLTGPGRASWALSSAWCRPWAWTGRW